MINDLEKKDQRAGEWQFSTIQLIELEEYGFFNIITDNTDIVSKDGYGGFGSVIITKGGNYRLSCWETDTVKYFKTFKSLINHLKKRAKITYYTY